MRGRFAAQFLCEDGHQGLRATSAGALQHRTWTDDRAPPVGLVDSCDEKAPTHQSRDTFGHVTLGESGPRDDVADGAARMEHDVADDQFFCRIGTHITGRKLHLPGEFDQTPPEAVQSLAFHGC